MMKAAVFHGADGAHKLAPMSIEEVPRPRPGADEALVKVAACGLCRTDLDYLKGEGPTPKSPPVILGHEPAGVIEEIGAGVHGLEVGQRVLVTPLVPCRNCDYCRTGYENLCPTMEILGATRDGAFAEYVLSPATGIFAVPDNLPLEEAAIITDAVATSYHALYRQANLQPGQTIAIFGASGGVGLVCVQLAAALGARVIGVGRQIWKLKTAQELGAAEVIAVQDVPKVDSAIRKMTGGGVDIAIDATGVPAMIETAIRSTRPGGKTVVVGLSYGKFEVAVNHLMWLERTIAGSKNYRIVDLPKVLTLVERGVVDLKRVISHRFKLDEINEAYQMLDRGEMLRGIVTP